MKTPVLTKRDMYQRLYSGEFGNTNPAWFTWNEWFHDPERRKYHEWGIRHTTIAGFGGTRLMVPSDRVGAVIRDGGFGNDYIISPMIYQMGRLLWEGDICRRHDGPGLLCSGKVGSEPGTWRTFMRSPDRWEGSAARVLLASVLNENSLADLEILLDNYPDHVVELTALDACFGTLPGRNGVVWELRRY